MYIIKRMSSIFDLKTNISELASSNQGTARMTYEQYPPTRDVTSTNFPNGAINIRWQTSGNKWWIPNRSYLRMRCQLSRGDGTPLRLSDNIAPNMALCANLFQSAEFRINDKTVSRISDFMPQVDALETRLTKSRSWIEGIGNSINFWEDEFKVRQGDVSTDATTGTVNQSITERLALGFDPLTTVTIAVDTGILTFATGTLPTLANIFIVGDEIELDLGGVVGTVRYRISALASATTLQLNNLKGIAFATAVVPFRRVRSLLIENEARKVQNFELNWCPPLSLFKVGHALCSGKYELVLNPQTSSSYQKYAIESLLGAGDKTAGSTAGTFKFSIVDMFMYVNTVDGPRADDLTYLLDLEQTRCQSDKIDTTSFGQKNLDVSPSTYALTVAYQDLRAGVNSQCSSSKFKSYNAGLTSEEETKLSRFFLNFAGQSYPQIDADPSYNATTDKTTQRYIES